MRKLLLVMMVSFASAAGTAQAAFDWGLELGVRQQGGSVAGPGVSANSQTGMQGGAFVHFPLEGGVAHFRTGLLYTQRPLQSENDSTGNKINFGLDYIDIPLDFLFKPKEDLGFYLGFNISVNISSSCSGNPNCQMNGVNTPLFPLVFGLMYKFTPKSGIDLYADGTNGNAAKGLYDYRAVGLNLTFSLE